MTALPGDPIAPAVNNQEQDRQSRRNRERFESKDVHAMIKAARVVQLRR